MLPFKKILFPVDFSEHCRGTAHYVEAFAGRFESEITLLHVVDLPHYNDLTPDSRTERKRHLEVFLAKELEYFRVKYVLTEGDPATGILQQARSENFDLIMMSTHGHGAFRRFLIGSVTAKVLHDAECPVWTGVHMEQAPPLEKIEFHRLLCAVDLEANGKRVIESAAELAEEYRAELTLLHVTPAYQVSPEIYVAQDLTASIIEKTRDYLEGLRHAAGAKAAVVVESGEVAKVVSGVARRLGADMLVIGRSPESGILGRLRTQAYSIIRQSPCPVLSV